MATLDNNRVPKVLPFSHNCGRVLLLIFCSKRSIVYKVVCFIGSSALLVIVLVYLIEGALLTLPLAYLACPKLWRKLGIHDFATLVLSCHMTSHMNRQYQDNRVCRVGPCGGSSGQSTRIIVRRRRALQPYGFESRAWAF
jgi:hypothetical protein